MIELYIVDLVACLGLEALADELELVVTDIELHVVKDGSETSVGDEPRLASVLVLEEGLDQQSLVLYIPTHSLETSI